MRADNGLRWWNGDHKYDIPSIDWAKGFLTDQYEAMSKYADGYETLGRINADYNECIGAILFARSAGFLTQKERNDMYTRAYECHQVALRTWNRKQRAKKVAKMSKGGAA